MNSKDYWKQRAPLLFLHFLCMAALALFLWANGNSLLSIALIIAAWLVILAAYLWMAFRARRAELDKLLALAGQLQERYLLPEVMEKPQRAEDAVYYRLLKLAGKSMLEQIGAVKRERAAYKEQVEQWVHEMKTPITAMRLLCENHRSGFTRQMLVLLEKINRDTEQALYCARSEHTEKDYCVRETRLFDAVHQAIAQNKYLLLQNGVHIALQETEQTAYTDEKWVCFILSQLIANAVKYRAENPELRFYTERQGQEIVLCVQDNGIGIDAGDLPRIFDKGFTGKNGRDAASDATGMGLYLCRRLCDKLGIGLSARSAGQGATLQLRFHISSFFYPLQG